MKDKAVLVIDMPFGCIECIFRSFNAYGRNFCKLSKKTIDKLNVRPDFCQLKPLPQYLSSEHVDYAHEASEINGWNKCVKTLLEDDLK